MQGQVKVVAILCFVCAGFSFLMAGYMFLQTVVDHMNDPNTKAQLQQMPSQQRELTIAIIENVKIICGVAGAVNLLLVAANVFAGIQLIQGKGRGLGQLVAVLNMLGIFACGACCISLPFGIYMMVVLSNGNVKELFRLVSEGKTFDQARKAIESGDSAD